MHLFKLPHKSPCRAAGVEVPFTDVAGHITDGFADRPVKTIPASCDLV